MDQEKLLSYFTTVNQKHFGGAISAQCVLGIPDPIQQNGLSVVPAAAYYPFDKRIVVHEALGAMRCPRYVYLYLLFHESLHTVIPSADDIAHSKEFLVKERFAPHRTKSIRWLIKHNFPVMEL